MFGKALKTGGLFLTGLAIGGYVGASGLMAHFSSQQPYKGQDQRSVSTLSADDIEQLKAGAGWGLAKPAEFNGYPGPKHVLEFAEKLALSDDQKNAITTSYDAMNKEAKIIGEQLIIAEAGLDAVFKDGDATSPLVEEKIKTAEELRAKLRAVHLLAHLEVTPVLNDEQKQQYTKLRGYGAGDHSGHNGH